MTGLSLLVCTPVAHFMFPNLLYDIYTNPATGLGLPRFIKFLMVLLGLPSGDRDPVELCVVFMRKISVPFHLDGIQYKLRV